MFQVNSKGTRTMSLMQFWCLYILLNVEHIPHLFLVFLLLTLNKLLSTGMLQPVYLLKVNNRKPRTRCYICLKLASCPKVSVVNFEHVIASWENIKINGNIETKLVDMLTQSAIACSKLKIETIDKDVQI